jgi:hypothetical protein
MVRKYGECLAVCESTANLWLKTCQAFERCSIGVKPANPLKTKVIAETKIKTDTLLYEVGDIRRFSLVWFFCTCCCSGNWKNGNAPVPSAYGICPFHLLIDRHCRYCGLFQLFGNNGNGLYFARCFGYVCICLGLCLNNCLVSYYLNSL